MKTILLNGSLWRIVRLNPGDPYLMGRIGVADCASRMIAISRAVFPPLLDRVLLHEIGHAVTMEHGMQVDEESAQLIEGHSVEAVSLASEVLGRPVCIDGICLGS